MQFIFAPIWGRVSDRVGRRPIILVGLFGSCLSYLGFGMASTLTALFAARIFAGIAGANIPTAQAVVADLTTPENRAKGMGIIGAAFGLGFIFGPAIGGFLSRYGYATPAFFASALSLANFVAAWFLLPETLKPEHRAIERVGRIDALRAALARPHLPLLLIISFLIVAAFSAYESTFALFAERTHGFHASSIGYIFAFVGVILVIVQGVLVGRVVKKVGEHHIMPASLAIVAVGLLMLPATRSLAALLVGERHHGGGHGLQQPGADVARVPVHRRRGPGRRDGADAVAEQPRAHRRAAVGRVRVRSPRHRHAVHQRRGGDGHRLGAFDPRPLARAACVGAIAASAGGVCCSRNGFHCPCPMPRSPAPEVPVNVLIFGKDT